MAWEKYTRNGFEGFTGDHPIDEFALALARIKSEYLARFERKPYLDEIIAALEIVICAAPDDYVEDSQDLRFAKIVSVQR